MNANLVDLTGEGTAIEDKKSKVKKMTTLKLPDPKTKINTKRSSKKDAYGYAFGSKRTTPG